MEFYNQESSQSSGGGFSMATPSPSPLTPTPPTTQSSIGSYEKVPTPPKREIESGDLASFAYLSMYPQEQQSPVKLTPLTDDLALDFYPATSEGESDRQMFKTREFFNFYFIQFSAKIFILFYAFSFFLKQ